MRATPGRRNRDGDNETMMKQWLGWLVLFLVATASAAFAGEPAKVEGPMTWGGVSNVTRYQNLYFAGQPDLAALEAAKEAGVQTVINLRAPGELRWDEASAVRGLAMRYENVPLSGRAFDADAIARIEALVDEVAGTPVLIHCASSNRVGGWFATHLVRREGRSVENALEQGRKAGITKSFVEAAVRTYLAPRDS
ncbi:MAG: hypothetical protein GY944_17850 [bacterium]|nr:hypothetical protein [bacterium]